MGNFTYANLILKGNTEIAKEYLEHNSRLFDLNDKWAYILTEQDSIGAGFSVNGFSPKMQELSEKIPILFFTRQDLEGFRFSILYKKRIVSSLEALSGFEENLPMDIAGEQGFDFFDLPTEECVKFEEIAKEKLNFYLDKHFSNVNAENFSLFDLQKAKVLALKELMTKKNFLNDYMLIHEAFEDILDISQLYASWESLNLIGL
jgi:hypothetical protein